MNTSTVIKKELPIGIEVKNNDRTNKAVAHWVSGIVYSEDDPANEETPNST